MTKVNYHLIVGLLTVSEDKSITVMAGNMGANRQAWMALSSS